MEEFTHVIELNDEEFDVLKNALYAAGAHYRVCGHINNKKGDMERRDFCCDMHDKFNKLGKKLFEDFKELEFFD